MLLLSQSALFRNRLFLPWCPILHKPSYCAGICSVRGQVFSLVQQPQLFSLLGGQLREEDFWYFWFLTVGRQLVDVFCSLLGSFSKEGGVSFLVRGFFFFPFCQRARSFFLHPTVWLKVQSQSNLRTDFGFSDASQPACAPQVLQQSPCFFYSLKNFQGEDRGKYFRCLFPCFLFILSRGLSIV